MSFFNVTTINWVGAEESAVLNEKVVSEMSDASFVRVALNVKNIDGSYYNTMMIET